MKGDHYSEEAVLTKIKQLRARISDIAAKDSKFNDDFYLHRWLLSRQCKVDRTATSIREAVIWREKNNFEQMLGKEWVCCPPELTQELPVTMDAYSKNGQPVITFDCDRIDIRSALQRFGRKTAVLYLTEMLAKVETVMMEHYGCKSKEPGKYVPRFPAVIIVATFKDFSIWNSSSLEVAQTFMEAASNGVKYFPCMASAIYMVNLNKFSAMLFKFVKPIIAGQPYTVGCYDTNRNSWPIELQELAKELPCLNSKNKVEENVIDETMAIIGEN